MPLTPISPEELAEELLRSRHTYIAEREMIENFNLVERNSPLQPTFSFCKFPVLEIEADLHLITFTNCQIDAISLRHTGNSCTIKIHNCFITTISITSDNKTVSLTINGSLNSIDEISVEGNSHTNINDGLIKGIKLYDGIHTISLASVNLETLRVSNTKSAYFRLHRLYNAFIELYRNDKIDLSIHQSTSTGIESSRTKSGNINVRHCRDIELQISTSTLSSMVLDSSQFNFIFFTGPCEISNVENNPKKRNHCNDLVFSDFILKENSKLHFTNYDFDHVSIKNFENKGSFEINSSSFKNSLSIRKGYLGKTVFNNFDIDEGLKFQILDSALDETKFINIRWRNKYLLQEEWQKENYTNSQDFLFAIRESYRQLKTNYLANGNKIEALEFQKNELRLHYEIVKRKTLESFILKDKKLLLNLCNYLILFTHKTASDFGLNIWKPLMFLFIFHFILFNILIYTHPQIGYGWTSDSSLEASIKAVGDYFTTMIPTHGREIIKFGTLDKRVYIDGFIDFLIRLCSAYFIFYFISATRKYHQNS